MLLQRPFRWPKPIFYFGLMLSLAFSRSGFAACGATNLTWYADAGTTAWSQNNNWATNSFPPVAHNNFPNAATENAIIRSDWTVPIWPNSNFTLGCFEIISGAMNGTPTGTRVMTIAGDYFKNLNSGSLTTNNSLTIAMSGTSNQSFTNVDAIDRLTLSNNTAVTLTDSFEIKSTGLFKLCDGTETTNGCVSGQAAATVYIDKTLTVSPTTAIVIPASTTLEIRSGGTLIAKGGITVNGVLKINGGGKVLISNTRNITINSGGVLQMTGSSGYVSTLDADGSGTNRYDLIVLSGGRANLNYFSINRTTSPGLDIRSGGILQQIGNGDFHFITANGFALTVSGTASVPATWNALGFFNDSSDANVKNINANDSTAPRAVYTGAEFTLTNFSGIGGSTYENDPGTKINWGSPAPTYLQVINATAVGNPGATIAKGSTDTLFATFKFSLTNPGSAATITSATITLDGNNTAGDIASIKIYRENGSDPNCTYDVGSDPLVGTFTPTGTPPTFTVSFNSGDIVATNAASNVQCIHFLVSTSAIAQTNNTLAIKIAATNDITNSQNYLFSDSGGPPVSGGSAQITGSATKLWNGGNSGPNWNSNANDWTPSGIPASTDDCQVGSAYSIPILSQNQTCTNIVLPSGGTINWNSSSNSLIALGSLNVSSTYNFSNASNGVILLSGSYPQSVAFQATFPGNITINKTNATDVVTINNNWTVAGNFTLNRGTLIVAAGTTLTVGGNIVLGDASGSGDATLSVEPGGTVRFSSAGKSLTVNTDASLQLVGNISQNSVVTSTQNTLSYSIVVNGMIKAQYYALSNLGGAGLLINSGATIDSTYHLQNGSFVYPIGSGTSLLSLNVLVPTGILQFMTFDRNGSVASGTKSINTTGAPAGTLTINSFSGDMTNNSDTTNGSYNVVWGTPTNTLKLTRKIAGPANLNQGETYNMGAFSFQQTQAGAFSDTEITSLRLRLTGTATSSDISAARIYYNSSCTGTGGTLLKSGTFSGTPPSLNFTGFLSTAPVQASVSSPPERCIYVEMDLSSSATNGATLGVQIESANDVVNTQNFAFNGNFSPPTTLANTGATIIGVTTTWVGTTNTDWCTATNWSGGLPTSSLNCIINDKANDPIINGTSCTIGTCKSITLGTGILSLSPGANLDVYGSFTNTGSLTQTGTLTIRDNGTTATTQTIQSSSPLVLSFNKTAGGNILIGNLNLTLNNFTIPINQNFTFKVQNGDTLVITNGANLQSGTFQIDGGGVVKIANSQTITLSGGTFKIAGTNDLYPQALSNKGKVTTSGTIGTDRWGFNSTTGTIHLVGFILESIDTNGLRVGGSSILSAFDGGQFTYLSSSYASMKALQINTSGSIPATASNIGWNWGDANGTFSGTPATSDLYTLAFSSGCGNQTLNFDQWFGNFYAGLSANPQSKVSTTACTLNIATSASAVKLTQLLAIPYRDAVKVKWSTQLEWEHQGFNVYRSLNPAAGYAQVNTSIIRNSTSGGGSTQTTYEFIDAQVSPHLFYYYMIEDVDLFGKRTQYGPVSAAPLTSLGSVTQENESVESRTGESSPTDPNSTPFTPGTQVLSENVFLLAKTSHSFRIKLIVPTPTWTPAAENSAYSRVSIAGYSSSFTQGDPELPEKVIMLEIPPSTSADFSLVTQTHALQNSITVAPAPAWTLSSGHLISSWVLNSATYALSKMIPSQPITLGTITQSDGRYYLPIHIQPISFNPVTQTTDVSSLIIIDLFLDGSPPWNVGSADSSSGPWGRSGGLKIQIGKAGVYQLSYNDLQDTGTEGPFKNADTNKLRMFYGQFEIPLNRVTSSQVFGPGDMIQFYAPFQGLEETSTNSFILYVDPSTHGARIPTMNASPLNMTANRMESFMQSITFEENHYGYFKSPYGEGYDHVLWKEIYSGATPQEATFTYSAQLPHLVSSSADVHLKIRLKGAKGVYSINVLHHLQLKINGNTHPQGEIYLFDNEIHEVEMNLPAQLFTPGANTIQLISVGDLMPGDYDIVDIDFFTMTYPHEFVTDSNSGLTIRGLPQKSAITISGFTGGPDLVAYDITDALHPLLMNGIEIQNPSHDQYAVRLANQEGSAENFDIWVGRKSEILKPLSIRLNAGSNLHSQTQGADAVFIGSADMLSAAAPLIDYRAQQGLRIKKVDIESIANEFGDGNRTAQSMKDFIYYAYTQWQAPALKNVILLGDGNYDPKNSLGFSASPHLLPIHLKKGTWIDYPSDNWFVAFNPHDELPQLAIGRIPGDSPAQISKYVQKVIDYENGTARPSTQAHEAKVSILTDLDQYGGEGFSQRASSLQNRIQNWNSLLKINASDRAKLSNVQMKSAILNAFESESTFVHYLGHGAEQVWADFSVFQNSDAESLNNSKLPVVVSMNCQTGSFSEADPNQPNFQTISDKLLFNDKGGAIAVWASSALTTPHLQSVFQEAFYQAALTQGPITLGEVIRRSKMIGGWSNGTSEVINSWNLLGDPLLQIKVPQPSSSAASDPTHENTSSQNNDGGSLGCACATIDGRGPGSGPGNGNAAVETTFLLLLYWSIWQSRRHERL